MRALLSRMHAHVPDLDNSDVSSRSSADLPHPDTAHVLNDSFVQRECITCVAWHFSQLTGERLLPDTKLSTLLAQLRACHSSERRIGQNSTIASYTV